MAFVLLPCDLPTWPTICKFLESFKRVQLVSEFGKIFYQLHEYCNVGINLGSFDASPSDRFASLENFLSLEAVELQFFTLTLPLMVDLALRIKELRPSQGLQYLLQQERQEISLKREFVASLLAHVFFCTMPRRTRNSHPTLTDPCLAPLLSSAYSECQRVKLKAFLHYFRLLAQHEAKGHVTYSRKVKSSSSLSTLSEWRLSPTKLCSFVIKGQGRFQERVQESAIVSCFVPSDIARSALTGENLQQVETMFAFPELLVAAILAEHLEDNEVFQASSTLRVASIQDLKSPNPSCVLLDEFEVPDVLHNLVDAQNYSGDSWCLQYNMPNLFRELNKAFVGFSSVTSISQQGAHTSSSDFISVSRQNSDDEDSGVLRDGRLFSSDENSETLDEKQRRMKSLCQRGFNQHSKQNKPKKCPLHSQNESLESNEFESKIQPENSPQRPTLWEKTASINNMKEDFAKSRHINISISSDGIKSLNRNIHRKKKKRRNKNCFKQCISLDTQNEKEKSEEERFKIISISSVERKLHPENETQVAKIFSQGPNDRMNFIEYLDVSTKDSDYLTSGLADCRPALDQTQKSDCRTFQEDTQHLIDKLSKAIKNLEAEKSPQRCASPQKFTKERSKDMTLKCTSHPEGSSLKSKENARIDQEEERAKLNISDKVSVKPPLPKSLKSKAPICSATSRKSQPGDSNEVSSVFKQNSEEDVYFSAFESLEHQDGDSTKAKCTKKRIGRRAKAAEFRRKSSFAQRLRETLNRGFSGDSTGKEEEELLAVSQDVEEPISSLRKSSPGKPRDQILLIRKLSSELNYLEVEETLEPCSSRFHNSQCTQSMSVEETNLEAAEALGMNSEMCGSQECINESSNSTNDSVSSHYSFSSDYSSDLNEVYQHVEEILQPLNDEINGPRELAVKRFTRSVLKRALSDSYKGAIFTLGGLSCFGDNLGSTKSLSLSIRETSPKDSGHGGEEKFHFQKPKMKMLMKLKQWEKIITGNWGCGKLGGDPQLKVLLQWAAASEARCSTFYFYPYNKNALIQLYEVVDKLEEEEWTVGDLIQSIVYFSTDRVQTSIIEDSTSNTNENTSRNLISDTNKDLFDFYLNARFKS